MTVGQGPYQHLAGVAQERYRTSYIGQPRTARSIPAPKTVVQKLSNPGLDPHAALNLGQVINSNFLFYKMMIMTRPSLQNLGWGWGLSVSFNVGSKSTPMNEAGVAGGEDGACHTCGVGP